MILTLVLGILTGVFFGCTVMLLMHLGAEKNMNSVLLQHQQALLDRIQSRNLAEYQGIHAEVPQDNGAPRKSRTDPSGLIRMYEDE